MATYQEQIAAQQESKARKAMSACVELAKIADATLILERDGLLSAEGRLTFLKAFVRRHPEINETLERQSAAEGSEK